MSKVNNKDTKTMSIVLNAGVKYFDANGELNAG